ncbi:hypothetical protein [Streptomyces sp. XH2]|uniref:hypothetical protein n=1 Tax=Streptomyces sp. XH2 TaxID=3412483 RepID=UPI003C7BD875
MPATSAHSTPRRRPLPPIGTHYALTSPLWRYQVLGDRKPHTHEVTHHLDGRVAFDGDTEHTFSTYWINKYMTRCQPDGSSLDSSYVERQREELQGQNTTAAALPSLDKVIDQLIKGAQA